MCLLNPNLLVEPRNWRFKLCAAAMIVPDPLLTHLLKNTK